MVPNPGQNHRDPHRGRHTLWWSLILLAIMLLSACSRPGTPVGEAPTLPPAAETATPPAAAPTALPPTAEAPTQAPVPTSPPPTAEAPTQAPAPTTAPPPPAGDAPAPVTTGAISGRLAYPSEFIPELLVYAIRVDDPSQFYQLTTALNQVEFTMAGLAPGDYHVFAYLASQPEATLGGAYTEYSLCGLRPECPSHELIAVPVLPGATAVVEVTDWYAPEGSLPPRPAGTALPLAPAPADGPLTEGMTPEETIRLYYDAINRRAYSVAYYLWQQQGAASGQTLEEFRAGYATTTSVELVTAAGPIEAAAGSMYGCVAVGLSARQEDGSVRMFTGAYTLQRSNNVPGGNPNWRIRGANVEELAAPTSLESLDLGGFLAQYCP